jgi:hypothetical protein
VSKRNRQRNKERTKKLKAGRKADSLRKKKQK